MAALSRPTLRSSARKKLDLELPATDGYSVERRSTRRQGKRTRDDSLDKQSNASSKRLKNSSPPDLTRTDDLQGKSTHARTLPYRGKQVTSSENAVTQVGRRTRKPPANTQETVRTGKNATQSRDEVPKPISNASNLTLNPVPIQKRSPQVEKRSLRSQDGGSRFKSELALYFPNYDDLISIEPKQVDTLTRNTVLFVTDEPEKITVRTKTKSSSPSSKVLTINAASKIVEWSEETFSDLTDAARIDLSKLGTKPFGRATKKDPLSDEHFIKVHRRLERQEKQLRNIEKERAMHEKVQLERLLEGLRGHDWLRTMGISGITDGEKKAYEPKRDHLIREVKVLLEKFRLWKEEEKRRKVEKEEESEESEEESESNDDDDGEDEESESGEEEGETAAVDDEDDDEESDQDADDEPWNVKPAHTSSSPDYTEIDASAARQLHHEAQLSLSQQSYSTTATNTMARSPAATKSAGRGNIRGGNFTRTRKTPSTHPPSHPPPAPATTITTTKSEPNPLSQHKSQMKQQEITSFFAKPYLRDAALGNHRRGRTQFLFGQPIPEVEERPFELPPEILTEEVLKKQERGRRAGKRGRSATEETS